MPHITYRLAPALLLLLLLLAPLSTATAAPEQQTPKPHLLTDPVLDPHQPGVQWFPATGHTLRGAFLDYWTRYGGLAQFGYPLTEEFFDSSDPNNKSLIQYFERNRFEYHPENAGSPYAVLLGTLGLYFRPADPPAPRPADPAALYFEPTGHSLSGAFKSYWQTHGGLFVHGYPITEPIQETNPTDGKTYTVQYFERSRFELHPENAGTPYEVLLGLLGTQLAQKQGYFYGWYPLYGHAADFSWIAGKFEPSTLMCFGCHCDTILYVRGGNSLDPNAALQPGGHIWKTVLAARPQINLSKPIVLFGYRSDNIPGLDDCLTSAYFVERVQTNPAQ